MYRRILVALENGPADETLVPHIGDLARRLGSELLLVHVADGWAARNFEQLKLTESDEMKTDRAYLETVAGRLRSSGLAVTTLLALGSPPAEIRRTADERQCDLIAMTSHGHKLLGENPDCAEALEVSPLQCLAFEDSFNGVIAAKAARMTCVAIPVHDQAHLPKWGAADLKLASLLEFTETHLKKLQ